MNLFKYFFPESFHSKECYQNSILKLNHRKMSKQKMLTFLISKQKVLKFFILKEKLLTFLFSKQKC